MKKLWKILAILAIPASSVQANVFTVNTDYMASLDVQRSAVGEKSVNYVGATWSLEKPIGLYYGMGARVLASPVNGYGTDARPKSMSIYTFGPQVGWHGEFSQYFGVAVGVLFGLGTASYNLNTGEYDDKGDQKVKSLSTSYQVIEPGLAILVGSYHDMQVSIGGGTKLLTKNSHPERTPTEDLAKPFIQIGIIQTMSEL
jgi:hypothetical protein